MTSSAVATRLQDVLEAELTSQVVQLARTLGWKRYHTHLSKKSASGFPDEVLVRERVVFLELKREQTKPTEAQKEWLRALLQAGAETYLVRPGGLQDLALVLASRGVPAAHSPAEQAQGRLREQTWRAVEA